MRNVVGLVYIPSIHVGLSRLAWFAVPRGVTYLPQKRRFRRAAQGIPAGFLPFERKGKSLWGPPPGTTGCWAT